MGPSSLTDDHASHITRSWEAIVLAVSDQQVPWFHWSGFQRRALFNVRKLHYGFNSMHSFKVKKLYTGFSFMYSFSVYTTRWVQPPSFFLNVYELCISDLPSFILLVCISYIIVSIPLHSCNVNKSYIVFNIILSIYMNYIMGPTPFIFSRSKVLY